MNQKQLMQRYNKELIGASLIYAIVLIASITLLKKFDFPQIWRVVISIAPSIPVALVILAIMRLLINSDELQQRIQLFATAFSAAVTGFVTFSYGFLENVGFPKFSTFLVFPMLVLIWGLSLRYFEKRYQ
jgi:hypothetical protein